MDTFNSGRKIIKNAFEQGIQEMMERSANDAKTVERVAELFPEEIVINKEELIKTIKSAMEVKGTVHVSYFKQFTKSMNYRDDRVYCPMTFDIKKEFIIWNGVPYVFDNKWQKIYFWSLTKDNLGFRAK